MRDELLDGLDRRLIAILREDARRPVATLATLLKVSRGTVQSRIDRLLVRGAIQGFTVRTRPEVDEARVRALMTIAVEGASGAAVLRTLAGIPEVARVHTTNGRWDLVAELDAGTLEAFSRTLDAIRQTAGISATETSILLATRKF